MKIEIDKLQPHPLNQKIYGYEDNNELLEKIKSSVLYAFTVLYWGRLYWGAHILKNARNAKSGAGLR